MSAFKDFYVIGDVHNRTKLIAKFLKEVNPRKIIWLGDFMDMWGDTPYDSMKTGLFMESLLSKRKEDIFILSNHDISYRFPMNNKYHGWGFSNEKCRAMHSQFNREHWEKFQILHREEYRGQTIVFSHAGLTRDFLPNGIFDWDFLKRVEKESLDHGHREDFYVPMLHSDFGPLWKRWVLPIVDGICQVVGHTPQETPEVNKQYGHSEWNLNLDCLGRGWIAHFRADGIFMVNLKTDSEHRIENCNDEIFLPRFEQKLKNLKD